MKRIPVFQRSDRLPYRVCASARTYTTRQKKKKRLLGSVSRVVARKFSQRLTEFQSVTPGNASGRTNASIDLKMHAPASTSRRRHEIYSIRRAYCIGPTITMRNKTLPRFRSRNATRRTDDANES